MFHQRFFRSRLFGPCGPRFAGAPNGWRRPIGLTQTFGQQLNIQSDKLPSYLQSLTNLRPARPSKGSLGKVSDAPGKTQDTWKPPDQSSLHNVCRTGIWPFGRCKLLLLQRIFPHLDTNRIGGAERDRTADPLLAKQVLSQLSYSPTSRWYCQIQPREWWARADSNCRPHAYQACALTT